MERGGTGGPPFFYESCDVYVYTVSRACEMLYSTVSRTGSGVSGDVQ